MNELTANEIHLLLRLIDERIQQADREGVTQAHPSSVFRAELRDKLARLLVAAPPAEAGDGK